MPGFFVYLTEMGTPYSNRGEPGGEGVDLERKPSSRALTFATGTAFFFPPDELEAVLRRFTSRLAAGLSSHTADLARAGSRIGSRLRYSAKPPST
ncbi:hypothetical protein GN244_ATG20442 [Phytophthora infestans]|uniref:Uncharacterized protein n=1 Tax=Phytophthora infestans TaxID=4787 RepID=A0A833WC78_PHYIN|nr:hypothetical protein GN244_ATG20442 [Phytophthora infestans]